MVKHFTYRSTKGKSIFSILPNKRRSKYLQNIAFTWSLSYDQNQDKHFLTIGYREPLASEEKERLTLNKKMNEIAINCIEFTLITEDSSSNNIMN